MRLQNLTPHHHHLGEFEQRIGVKAEPCPFCRSRNLMIYIGRKANIECFGCGAEGPYIRTDRDDPSRAIIVWNIRGEINGLRTQKID